MSFMKHRTVTTLGQLRHRSVANGKEPLVGLITVGLNEK